VVAGTATVVAKGVSGKMSAKDQAAADAQAAQQANAQQEAAQQQQLAQQQSDIDALKAGQQPAAAPVAPTGDTVDIVVELQKLAALKEAGVLTDEEFAAAKTKLLA